MKLTLGRTISQTSGWDGTSHGRSDVDDTSSFLIHPFAERSVVRILRVDRIRHTSIDHKRPIRVDDESVLEILISSRVRTKNRLVYLKDSRHTLQLSTILLDHLREGAMAAQWTPPNRLPLGMSSSARVHASDTASTSDISVLI